ncbi:MAG: alpha-ketoacid dehydrogenase subunit beta [Ardenticatenaceae bacterium]|nr:alpha-ketoacid dehydrogenase subunit beta [Ardenticatenaceae bacterium]
MARRYIPEAVRDGLREEMARDPDVVLLGEDIKISPYGFERGLYDEFGPERVRNTPIAEQTMAGVGLGAAACGLRPVVDMFFGNFLYTGMDQLANQVAKLRYMTGGQIKVPVVYLAVMGAGSNVAAQHSDSPHPLFMNLAGIKVVIPTTPADAKGLIRSAIRDDDPVLFLVPTPLLGVRGEIPDEEYLTPVGVAEIRQQGSDVTIVGIGSTVREALRATRQFERDGISIEVIDVRTVHPLDTATILRSVAKTGRLVVTDEARELCSAASEIAAIVVERGFRSLKAPVRRVTAPNVPVPFSPPLEKFVMVSAEKIANAIRQVIDY